MYDDDYRPKPIPDNISDGVATVRVFTDKPTDTKAYKVTNFFLKELHRSIGTPATMDGNHIYLTFSLNMGNEYKHEEIIELCIPLEKTEKIFELLRDAIKTAKRNQQWRFEEQLEKARYIAIGENH